MSTTVTYRVAAVALIAGGVLGVLSSVFGPASVSIRTAMDSPLFYPSAVASLISAMLILGGLPAVYLIQRGESGLLGLVGMMILLATGMLMAIALSFTYLVILPWVAGLPVATARLDHGPAAFGILWPALAMAMILGAAIFGTATIRAGVLSPWLGVALTVAAVLNLVLGFLDLPGMLASLGGAALDLVLGWYGLEVWTRAALPATVMVGSGRKGATEKPISAS
ncbi:MAG TPA: hypothetical protein VIA06_24330 [Candidatus Dormibacteraeota bacterium]|jgi:hypothetical protein|nr:hypothetical protein [Candidatus Dormibacteraeota bacterium]